MNYLDLPVEMLEKIAYFLPVESLCALSKTCRKLNEITRIDELWQALCYQEYGVASNKGWNLSFRDIYTKVLKEYRFLGLKRLALTPFGGMVHVCWGEGEIQVNLYEGQNEDQSSGTSSELLCQPLFSLRWNEALGGIEIQCIQNSSGPKPAILSQGGKYPLLRCADVKCWKSHEQKNPKQGQTDKRFPRGFLDHPDAFKKFKLSKGYNCPMLPLPLPTEADQNQSPIQLGLYIGYYGSHGDEILNLMINSTNAHIMEGLKIIGDVNVPAGNISVTVYLDKPIVLSKEDQSSLYGMMKADEDRSDESFQALLNSNNNNPDLRQPFLLPPEIYDEQVAPSTCLARYLGKGRIANDFYTNPTHCKCHFIKFSDVKFGVLWLELGSFTMFYKVEKEFAISSRSST